MIHKSTVLVSMLLVCSCFAPAQSAALPKTSEAPGECRSFVQNFYDWYVPMALHAKGRAWDDAVRRKPEAFTPELIAALQRDSAAQAKTPDDIVGLDFDPFLGSQDPSKLFTVQAAKEQATACTVTVVGGSTARKGEEVGVDLERANGSWRFVNFHYGNDPMDLRGLLVQMEKDRNAESGKKN